MQPCRDLSPVLRALRLSTQPSASKTAAEFAVLPYFALNGTDHLTHAEQNAAIGSFVR